MSTTKKNEQLSQTPVIGSAFFLCSEAVIEHFPNFEKSKPFKSGYDLDDDNYYIISTEHYKALLKYYDEVIEPFNEKSTVEDIDFWFRPCEQSFLSDCPKGAITRCRTVGVFRAIESFWNLTNESNRAFAIFKMAEYYGMNPIEFINRVVR